MVFLDGDLRNFSATYVTGLLGPLLTDPAVDLVKAFYDRSTHTESDSHNTKRYADGFLNPHADGDL